MKTAKQNYFGKRIASKNRRIKERNFLIRKYNVKLTELFGEGFEYANKNKISRKQIKEALGLKDEDVMADLKLGNLFGIDESE